MGRDRRKSIRMTEQRKEHFILISFMGILGIVLLLFLGKAYGPIQFPDEYGYWAQAANLMGYDWSAVSSMYLYYSFGYSLLLTILMRITENPTLLYQCAVVTNFVLLCGSILLLHQILKEILKSNRTKLIAMTSGVGILYSSFLVYMHITFSEIMLVFGYLLTLYLFLRFTQNCNWINTIFLAGSISYLYMVHMRTIGCLLATFICVWIFAWRDKKKRSYALLFSIILLILFCFSTFWKNQYMDAVYGMEKMDTAKVNDYGGQIGKILQLFTLRGIWNFLCSVMGKVFYLGASTYGLFFWGIVFVGKETKAYFIKKDKTKLGSVYILSATFLTICVSAVGMLETGRLDGVMYGRYNEMVIPVVVSLGVWELWHTTERKKGLIVYLVLQSTGMLLCSLSILERGLAEFYPYSVLGLNCIYQYGGKGIRSFLNITYLVTGLLAVGLVFFVQAIAKANKYYLLYFVIALQVITGVVGCKGLNLDYQSHYYKDVQLVKKLRKLCDERQNVYYVYNNVGTHGNMALLQYHLQEKSLRIVIDENVEETGKDDFLIIYVNDELLGDYDRDYTLVLQSNHYKIYQRKQ